ncbi:MAG TPA: HupE/UreJ family protein [Chitinophagaceae bacterium]|nr:HupE/UreJ family protein [Chitinophagaceae bacterium]
MTNKHVNNSRRTNRWRLFFLASLLAAMALMPGGLYAHQTPSTIALLDVSPGKVTMELQLPLSELELAFGMNVTKDAGTLVQRLGPQLKEYILAHIHVMEASDKPWLVEVTGMQVEKAEQVASGPPFQEMTVHLVLTPYPGASTRKFILDYDVIMHQVINHTALVSIRNDWELGKAGEQLTEAGVIRVDTRNNVIYPLEINLEEGSWWTGFKSMLRLGMQHIKEGTDHLLFLLVLLLPATLLVSGRRWGKSGGTKYSVVRLLKIVTAFTIGHSITLLIGALGWLRLPAQPVEIGIAVSILVSAIHAVYPIFPGREMYVAAGFGLVHGLAFAAILAKLNLGAGPMALSILGFNLGIEFMQLFVIALVVPWLILLSHTPAYAWLRITGAVLAGIAALAWVSERVSGQANRITGAIQYAAPYFPWVIVTLAVVSFPVFGWYRWKNKNSFA